MLEPLHIAYMPLDDRPANLDAVYMLARLGGIELELPPAEMLGHFTTPGDVDALRAWVGSLGPRVTHLIASLDMLCHGGLLASRAAPAAADGEAEARALAGLDCLEALRRARPDLRISALGVLLRTSISVTGEADLELWRRVHDVAARDETTPANLAGELKRAKVPEEAAEAYARARARNLKIHRAAIAMARRETLDYLLLCQEDAAPRGVHRHEQTALHEEIAGHGLFTRISIQPGADEGGMLLLARAALRHHKLGLGCVASYGPGGPNALPLYEDASISESYRLKLATLGGKSSFGVPLHVHALDGPGEDLFLLQREGRQPSAYDGPLAQLEYDSALADVSVANGAEPAFIARMLERTGPFQLASFAAWNTASNSIGTVLAHLAMREIGRAALRGHEMAREHLAFLATRWADDYLYQTVVRPRLIAHARQTGHSVFNLDDESHQLLQAMLEEEMEREFGRFVDEHKSRGGVTGYSIRGMRGRFSLPWPRLFEIRARVQVEVG